MGLKVCLDIDGVLADFTSKFDSIVQANSSLKSDFSRYDLKLPDKEFKALYDLMIDAEILLDLKEYQSAAFTVQRWAKFHDIWYVTRRRPGNFTEMREHHIQVQTKIWLLRNGFPKPQQVVFTQDKANWCRENGAEVAIEDFLGDARKLNGIRTSRGFLRCYLINRPWNQGDYPSARRVTYLQEVVELDQA